MTTITLDTRTIRLRVPVLRLGRLRGSLVLQITEHVELRVEEHRHRAAGAAASRARSARAHASALDRADAHRTAALAHRLPSF